MLVVDDDQQRKHHLAKTNFTPHHPLLDPTLIFAKAYSDTREKKIPKKLHRATPAPNSYKTGHKYPDDVQWSKTHEAKLAQLDEQLAVEWLLPQQYSSDIRPISLTMT